MLQYIKLLFKKPDIVYLKPLKVEEYINEEGVEMQRLYFTNTERPDCIVSQNCWFKQEEN